MYSRMSKYDLLGKGAFGLVVQPALPNGATTYPKNDFVTKVIYRKSTFNKTLKNYDRIANIMGNNSYKAYPHQPRHYKNLPPNVQNMLRKERPLNYSNPVYAVRMPHLGVSLTDVLRRPNEIASVRQTPFVQILGSITKCIGQLARLQKKRMLHGDIRLPNVLWNKKTGGIHIIDFDWLYPYEEFDKRYRNINGYGFYSNPPETLYLNEEPEVPYNWQTLNQKEYSEYIQSIPDIVKAGSLNNYMYVINNANISFISDNVNAIQHNDPSIDELDAMHHVIMQYSFPSFDSYALGIVLFEFMSIVFGNSYKNDSSSIKKHLRTTCSMNGVPYSREYIDLIETVMTHLLSLFEDMSRFTFESRMDAVTAYETMNQIFLEFLKGHNRLLPEQRMNATALNQMKREINALSNVNTNVVMNQIPSISDQSNEFYSASNMNQSAGKRNRRKTRKARKASKSRKI